MLKQLVVEQAKRPLIPDPCPAALRALIERCWAQQPEARPAFDAILEQVCWAIVCVLRYWSLTALLLETAGLVVSRGGCAGRAGSCILAQQVPWQGVRAMEGL